MGDINRKTMNITLVNIVLRRFAATQLNKNDHKA